MATTPSRIFENSPFEQVWRITSMVAAGWVERAIPERMSATSGLIPKRISPVKTVTAVPTTAPIEIHNTHVPCFRSEALVSACPN